MSAFIFIAGLAIGVSAFLYFISALSGNFGKPVKNSGRGKSDDKRVIEPEAVTFRGRGKIPPGARICPLCGSELTKYEGLYASKVTDKNEPKILIMGCKYCFKEK